MAHDILRITNMMFHAYHGVWDEEQEIGQRFEVDLELKTDIRPSAESDKLKDTVDLYAVFEAVENVISKGKYRLLETMAEKVCQKILAEFAVMEVLIRIRKPHAPIRGIQDGIEVEIVRTQKSSG